MYARRRSEVRINYQGIGSGGGVKQLLYGTVDFGATDAPMTDEQLSRGRARIVHVPTAVGAVFPIYNLPDRKPPLVFSGRVLADLFLGRINRWNAPELAEQNPGLALPDRPVGIVHRSDGSGTTFVLTDYLSKMSGAWAKGPGRSTAVNWPVGAGKGNDGVAADLGQNEGSLGHVELVYAVNNDIPYGDVVNAAGRVVRASVDSTTAAAARSDEPTPDLRISITDAKSPGAYDCRRHERDSRQQRDRNSGFVCQCPATSSKLRIADASAPERPNAANAPTAATKSTFLMRRRVAGWAGLISDSSIGMIRIRCSGQAPLDRPSHPFQVAADLLPHRRQHRHQFARMQRVPPTVHRLISPPSRAQIEVTAVDERGCDHGGEA